VRVSVCVRVRVLGEVAKESAVRAEEDAGQRAAHAEQNGAAQALRRRLPFFSASLMALRLRESSAAAASFFLIPCCIRS